ncbi:MAG: N-carbamoyl-D-amino-acid hydrolase, partial [Acidimicrobiia bacterium]|nr:N-carbamoyl-D-amino-acid hydrolase [Acidimicrobiia bacterium]
TEEGVESLAESCIIAPSGQIVAQAVTAEDELISAVADLERCKKYKDTLFDFDQYRRPEMYLRHTRPRGVAHAD